MGLQGAYSAISILDIPGEIGEAQVWNGQLDFPSQDPPHTRHGWLSWSSFDGLESHLHPVNPLHSPSAHQHLYKF